MDVFYFTLRFLLEFGLVVQNLFQITPPPPSPGPPQYSSNNWLRTNLTIWPLVSPLRNQDNYSPANYYTLYSYCWLLACVITITALHITLTFNRTDTYCSLLFVSNQSLSNYLIKLEIIISNFQYLSLHVTGKSSPFSKYHVTDSWSIVAFSLFPIKTTSSPNSTALSGA